MAIGLGSAAGQSGGFQASPWTTASVGNTTSGSTFVVVTQDQNAGAVTAVSDSNGNNYTKLGTSASTGGSVSQFWYKENGTGGTATTVTLTLSASTSVAMCFIEITGAATASQDVFSDWVTDASSPFTSGTTAATNQAAEMAVAVCYAATSTGTFDWSANGYTQATSFQSASDNSMSVAYKILSSTGAQQGSCTQSGSPFQTNDFIATFKEAAAGSSNSIFYIKA